MFLTPLIQTVRVISITYVNLIDDSIVDVVQQKITITMHIRDIKIEAITKIRNSYAAFP